VLCQAAADPPGAGHLVTVRDLLQLLGAGAATSLPRLPGTEYFFNNAGVAVGLLPAEPLWGNRIY